jgi:ribosome biogenesis GTPase A
MAKTRRLMKENLKNVDVVIELLDARIPQSSRNPEIERLIEGKPLVTLLNKSSLADPAAALDASGLWHQPDPSHTVVEEGLPLVVRIDVRRRPGLELV